MRTSLISEIRSRVVDCVEGRISVRGFRDWFATVAWNIETSEQQSAIQLVYRIDGLLAEAGSADWSDQGTKEELALAMHSLLVERKPPTISRPALNMTPFHPSARRSTLALVS